MTNGPIIRPTGIRRTTNEPKGETWILNPPRIEPGEVRLENAGIISSDAAGPKAIDPQQGRRGNREKLEGGLSSLIGPPDNLRNPYALLQTNLRDYGVGGEQVGNYQLTLSRDLINGGLTYEVLPLIARITFGAGETAHVFDVDFVAQAIALPCDTLKVDFMWDSLLYNPTNATFALPDVVVRAQVVRSGSTYNSRVTRSFEILWGDSFSGVAVPIPPFAKSVRFFTNDANRTGLAADSVEYTANIGLTGGPVDYLNSADWNKYTRNLCARELPAQASEIRLLRANNANARRLRVEYELAFGATG